MPFYITLAGLSGSLFSAGLRLQLLPERVYCRKFWDLGTQSGAGQNSTPTKVILQKIFGPWDKIWSRLTSNSTKVLFQKILGPRDNIRSGLSFTSTKVILQKILGPRDKIWSRLTSTSTNDILQIVWGQNLEQDIIHFYKGQSTKNLGTLGPNLELFEVGFNSNRLIHTHYFFSKFDVL